MPDWTASMQQTFEYYIVDPGTWKDVRLLDTVKSCTITRESDSETRGSATFDITETIGECYIRTYLVTIQNGVRERFPLGTFLVQTPSYSFDGKVKAVSADAYTPLLELKEKHPPIGYYVSEGVNIMSTVGRLSREHTRAPIVGVSCDEVLNGDFVAMSSDTWLTFIRDLMAQAKYSFDLDELGRILFSRNKDMASLQPVWTYDDGNSSILLPDFSLDRDLYGIPNVVEVIYSGYTSPYTARVVNDDSNSPISTVNRGREIVHRVTDPSFTGDLDPTKHQIDEYATQLLKELSTLEYTLSYSHGYCPVRVGDCVRINYSRSGYTGLKAKVISQSIKCDVGCQVTEKAICTTKFWR